MKNIMQMMQKAQEMQKKMEQVQKELENESYTSQSGGGLVSITIKGSGEISRIEIDDSLIKIDEKEMLADLIAAAYNSAKKQSTEASNNKMKDLTGGLGLPSGFKIPGLF